MTEKAVAAVEKKKTSLAAEIAGRMSIEPHVLLDMMKQQIITVPAYGNYAHPPTNEELLVVMSIMKELDLTPVVREIHAWRGFDGKLTTMVGYDGWVKCARRDPGYSHVSYEYGPIVESPDGRGKKCPEWIAPTVHFKDGRDPAPFPPVMLEEWYVPAREKKKYPGEFNDGPWQHHTSNRLRQKAFTIAVREVFGMAVLDDVDAEWAKLADEHPGEAAGRQTGETVNREADRLRQKMAAITDGTADAEYEEMEEPEAQEEAEGGMDAEQPGADDAPEGPTCYVPGCKGLLLTICNGCGDTYCADHDGGGGYCLVCGSMGPPDPQK